MSTCAHILCLPRHSQAYEPTHVYPTSLPLFFFSHLAQLLYYGIIFYGGSAVTMVPPPEEMLPAVSMARFYRRFHPRYFDRLVSSMEGITVAEEISTAPPAEEAALMEGIESSEEDEGSFDGSVSPMASPRRRRLCNTDGSVHVTEH